MSESEIAKKVAEILRAKGHDVAYVAIEPSPQVYDAEGKLVAGELPKEEAAKVAYCEVAEGKARCAIGEEPLEEIEVPLSEEPVAEVGHEEGGPGEGAGAEAEAG